jgi:tetratricopeptide (TPR) repeat protein
MDTFTPTMNAVYLEYARKLLQHHRLLAEGREAADETIVIEDEMTELWDQLDAIQRKSLSGLSSDLNWVRRDGKLAPLFPKEVEISVDNRVELLKAYAGSDWHKALHQSRIMAALNPLFELASARGAVWEMIGQPSIAWIFFDFASRLRPRNGVVAYLALKALLQEDYGQARANMRAILQDDSMHPTLVVIFSLYIQLLKLKQECRSLDQSHFVDPIRRCLGRVEHDHVSAAEKVETYRFAGLCFEILKAFEESLRCYNEALNRAPNDVWLLIHKGYVLNVQGGATAEAAATLEHAARLAPRLVWPFYALAHLALVRREYAEAFSRCLQAFQKAPSASIKATILEWMAISASELSLPEEVIRSIFHEAEKFDPSNSIIKLNREAFESSQGRDDLGVWNFDGELLAINEAYETPSLLSETLSWINFAA